MPNVVTKLMVNRVDLVDEGANSEAYIRLYKRKEQEKFMNYQELLKLLKPEYRDILDTEMAKIRQEADSETISKKLADVEAELTIAKDAIVVLEGEINKTKEKIEISEEEIVKSLDPKVQEIFKNLKAEKQASELIAKQLQEKELEILAKSKAVELKAIPVEEAKLVEMLKKMPEEVYEILKAANRLIEKGPILNNTVGSGNQTSNIDAWAQIEKRAEGYMTDSSLTKEKAIAKVIRENPELYKAYTEGGMN